MGLINISNAKRITTICISKYIELSNKTNIKKIKTQEQKKPQTTSILKMAKNFLQQEGITEKENSCNYRKTTTKLSKLQCNKYIRNTLKRLERMVYQ